MTIPSTPRRAGPYIGTGALVSYSFSFKVFSKSDVAVTIADTNGNETLLTLDSTVLVTVNPDQVALPGGSVQYAVAGVATALPSGYSLTILTAVEYKQSVQLPSGGNYRAEIVEQGLDALAVQIQQQGEVLARALVFSPTDAAGSILPPAASRADRLLAFDSTGRAIAVAPVNGSATGLALDLANTASAIKGDALIGVKLNATGSVARTQHDVNAERVSVFDFGAKGDNVTDDTAAIQKAITYIESCIDPAAYGSYSPAAGPLELFFPSGTYKLTDALIITKPISIRGEGHSEFSTGARLLQYTAAKDHFKVQPIAQGASVSWDDLTMTANGGGGTGGVCINITKAAGTSNSVRIRNCTFGTPQSAAIKLQNSDDVMIHDNLFDVSATACIVLGTTTSTDAVSNCSIRGNTFYAISNSAILVYNVTGLLVESNRVYRAATNLNFFIDGYNTLPYQLKNISIQGNSFTNVNCLAKLTAVNGLVMSGNVGSLLGAGAGSTLSCIELTGGCTNVAIHGNVLSGAFDTKNFYNDAAATVTGASIGGNTFVNTAGTGVAIVTNNTAGTIGQNSSVGFATPSVGDQFFTTGNAISPGSLGAGGAFTYTTTIQGLKQGDKVTITPISFTDPVPNGVVTRAWCSAANTASIKYFNPTAGTIGVPAHDMGLLGTR